MASPYEYLRDFCVNQLCIKSACRWFGPPLITWKGVVQAGPASLVFGKMWRIRCWFSLGIEHRSPCL